jgi:hypothetical protein
MQRALHVRHDLHGIVTSWFACELGYIIRSGQQSPVAKLYSTYYAGA